MERLLGRLKSAWERSDFLFALLAEGALVEQPIPLRQPFIFYLGHLPAFAWNHLGRGERGWASFNPRFDALFERGIDPMGVDEYRTAEALAWPAEAEVVDYRDRVREALESALGSSDERLRRRGLLVLEHELMHHETLLYMVQQLPSPRKKRPPSLPEPLFEGAAAPGEVAVPPGEAVLGRRRGSLEFGWDNEFPEHRIEVPGFRIDRTAVRNSEYLEFVEAGGYAQERFWDEGSWAWRRRRDVHHPLFWRRSEAGWAYRGLFEELPLARAGDWPVYVSWAEASAYARWRGARLPTEAEFHRATYGTPDGPPRSHPWGEGPPSTERGNFGFRHWSPTPVGAHAAGASAWDVLELVGNGWEWTRSPFAPFPGFAALPVYPGYSQDFVDGRHYVMLGASWATDDALVRRSFRNWFQPHYPYVFAKFRCVSA